MTRLPTLLLAIVVAGPAGAAELRALMTIKGACQSLIIGPEEIAPNCKGILLNTSFSDGRSGFYFVSDDGATITFSGDGNKQVKSDADHATQPIDAVIFSYKGKTEKYRAVGACSFANPYKGPTDLVCSAETERSKFSGRFRTDGSTPEVKKIGRR